MNDKMGKARLRWFEHMRGRSPDAPVRRYARVAFAGMKRGKEWPKMYWGEVIKSHGISTDFRRYDP